MKEYELKESDHYMRCTRCGKYVTELIPFNLELTVGLPTCGGNRLVKRFRNLDFVEYHEESEIILKDMSTGKSIDELNRIYGTKKVEAAGQYESLKGYSERSWECKDCIQEEGDFKTYKDK
jgi:hypothetical protein